MIVGDDHPRGAVCKRICKDFARVDGTAVDQTYRNDSDVQNLICSIDCGAEEMFLFPDPRSAGPEAGGRLVFQSSPPPV